MYRHPIAASLPLVSAAQLAAEAKVEEADSLLASAAAAEGVAPIQRRHLQLMQAHLAATTCHPGQVSKCLMLTRKSGNSVWLQNFSGIYSLLAYQLTQLAMSGQ